MQVGVIGVGRMGGAMARNLLKEGHRLTVFDMAKEPLRELAKDGVSVAASAKEAFAGDAVAHGQAFFGSLHRDDDRIELESL